MPNHIIEVLFQGIWSSLTGGWFYDPHLSLFINTVHMYAWIFLFSFPFLIYLLFEPTLKIWSIYITINTVIFLIIKLTNYQLNRLFDKNKIKLIEKSSSKDRSSKSQSSRRKLSRSRRKMKNIAETEMNNLDDQKTGGEENAQEGQKQQQQIDDKDDNHVYEMIIVNENSNTNNNCSNDVDDIDSKNFNDVIRNLQNSPTNRSLFKISEESLDQQKTQNDQNESNKNDSTKKISFSTIIANGPSFQDTTVSDTKLFNGNHKQSNFVSTSATIETTVASTNAETTTNPAKIKRRNYQAVPKSKLNVRRFNSDLTYKNKHLKNTSETKTRNRSSSRSSSSSSSSRSNRSNSDNSISKSNNVDLNRNNSIEKAKSANLNNNLQHKRKSRKRAKSFNYLFKTNQAATIPPTPPPTIFPSRTGDETTIDNKTKQVDDNYSNYSSASSIVSLISPNSKAIANQNNQSSVNIDDLKDNYLKHKQQNQENELDDGNNNDLNEILNCLNDLDEKLKDEEEAQDIEKCLVMPRTDDGLIKNVNDQTPSPVSLASLVQVKSTSSQMRDSRRSSSSSSSSTTFSTASSRSSSYSSLKSSQSIKNNENINQNDIVINLDREEYEKQGARPKIRPIVNKKPKTKQINRNKKTRRRYKKTQEQHQQQQQQQQKDYDYSLDSIEKVVEKLKKIEEQKEEIKPEASIDESKRGDYDFNDTSEGTVHYYVENNNLFRYKFDRLSYGTPELVNPNDKNFNLNEIPSEFHKYLKLKQTTSSRSSRTSVLRSRLRNNDIITTNLDEIKFKAPPPPPLPSKPSTSQASSANYVNIDFNNNSNNTNNNRSSIKRQDSHEDPYSYSLDFDVVKNLSDNDSSSEWSDHNKKITNIDQIEAAPAASTSSHRHSVRPLSRDQLHMRLRSRFIHTAPSNTHNNTLTTTTTTPNARTSHTKSSTKKSTKYKLKITKKFSIKIPFDRRSLQSMLDNNKTIIEIIFICFLAFLVSLLASMIFIMNLYQDFTLILFCCLIASCHYSLLKSCTPDSSSPIHGFNNILSFSRSIYFCLTCLIIILLDYLLKQTNDDYLNSINIKLYNYDLIKYSYIEKLKNFFETFLLFQPLLFLIGLYPQINTFLISLIEQIDMNLFGGTAMQSLASSIVSLIRSLCLNSLLALVLYLNLFKMYSSNVEQSQMVATTTTATVTSTISTDSSSAVNLIAVAAKAKFSQTIQFSLYCSLVVLFSYLTSRQSTNYTVIYNLIKRLALKLVSLTINNDTTAERQQQQPPQQQPSSPPQQQQPGILLEDPLPKKLENTIKLRLESDILISIFIFLFIFAIHASTVFSTLDKQLNEILFLIIIPIGIINHYLIPNLRLEYPWSMFNQPFLKQKHWSQFEPNSLAKLCWYERVHVYINFIEKNILNIIVLLSTMTICIDNLLLKLSIIDNNGYLSCLFITILSTKLIRYSYCEPSKQYQLYLIAYLFNKFDVYYLNYINTSRNINCMIIDLYLLSILLNKFYDFCDKLNFIYVYTAPWQLPWGSAFHAFAQPLSLPHSTFLLIQIVLSCIIGSPIMPLMGSAIFLLSYMRPIKFWEKNYNTKRVDNTNTRLQSQFDGACVDSENLNAIFYEHLTCVLQNTLCGDIQLGRWGNVHSGDFYILSSDYLNCLVHIIEMGNGFLTFQLRGLEFKGTYCQQRELEAISEDYVENKSCCCCKIGRLRGMLSFNTIFQSKWLAWKIIERKYIVDSYRIIDNDLSLIVNFFSLRSTLIDFYVKSAIYYLIKSPKLQSWLTNKNIKTEIDKCIATYADYDACFDHNLDCDYDTQAKAITYAKFSSTYHKWIQYCNEKRVVDNESARLIDDVNSDLSKLCFLLSLACRRALATACNGGNGITAANANAAVISALNNQISVISRHSTRSASSSSSSSSSGGFGVSSGITLGTGTSMPAPAHNSNDSDCLQSFQHGYYTLFKGDIRIQSPKDEWLFNDIDLLNSVIIKSVRMSLRLHQDHFQFDQTDEQTLYENLLKYDNESVITYERDPIWRHAVLNNIPSLLALRHQLTEFSDQYKVVMLNKNFLSFRVIKINKECVRSFWAGQQHELIFLRNKNQERGSIQNAKQVLRNIINSSCDQPIGYPIYVSPLTTSYSSTHKQLGQIIGPELSFKGIYDFFRNLVQRVHNNCTNNCSGSSTHTTDEQLGPNVSYSARTDALQINLNSSQTPNPTSDQQPQTQPQQSPIPPPPPPPLQRGLSTNSENNDSFTKKTTPTSTLMNSLNAASGTFRSSIRSNSSNESYCKITKPTRFQTIERVSITDINQIVDLETISNINKYNYLSICSKTGSQPRNGMQGILYRKHIVSNGTILPYGSKPLINEDTKNSYHLCIIKIGINIYLPIKESGIDYLQESTYL